MTNYNSMRKWEYLLANVVWIFVAMVWFQPWVFIPLPDLSESTSKKILGVMIAVLVILGIIVTFKRRRNYLSVVVNVLLPYELYAMTAHWHRFGNWAGFTLLIATLLSCFFLFFVMLQRISPDVIRIRALLTKRLKHALLGVRVITVLCLCAFIFPLGVHSYREMNKAYENPPQEEKQESTASYQSDKWTIAQNVELLMNIKPERWERLSVEERMETLEVIKNIEMRYLGVCHEVSLEAAPLDGNKLGCFYTGVNKIVIDAEHLQNGSASELLNTLTHECHHAYTRQQVEVYQKLPAEYKDMLLFHVIKTYEEEYANYVNGTEDYAAYKLQLIEKHARDYAEEAVEDYYRALSKYENSEV